MVMVVVMGLETETVTKTKLGVEIGMKMEAVGGVAQDLTERGENGRL